MVSDDLLDAAGLERSHRLVEESSAESLPVVACPHGHVQVSDLASPPDLGNRESHHAAMERGRESLTLWGRNPSRKGLNAKILLEGGLMNLVESSGVRGDVRPNRILRGEGWHAKWARRPSP